MRTAGRGNLTHMTRMTRAEIEAFYRRYNARCNAHEFPSLVEFVAPDVVVNAESVGHAGYVAGLEAVGHAFPDFRWEIQHLLIDGPIIAAHFATTGTHRGPFLGIPATGRSVDAYEFAFYRIAHGKIAEVWGTADNLRLLDQMRD